MITARPTAVPIWAAEFSSPDATPRSVAGATPVPTVVDATEAIPNPNPIRAKLVSSRPAGMPWLGSVVRASAPAATSPNPTIADDLGPSRVISRGPASDPAITVMFSAGK